MKMNYKDMLKDGKGTEIRHSDIAFNTKSQTTIFQKYFKKINQIF